MGKQTNFSIAWWFSVFDWYYVSAMPWTLSIWEHVSKLPVFKGLTAERLFLFTVSSILVNECWKLCWSFRPYRIHKSNTQNGQQLVPWQRVIGEKVLTIVTWQTRPYRKFWLKSVKWKISINVWNIFLISNKSNFL